MCNSKTKRMFISRIRFLYVEHFKFSDTRLHALLMILFNCMFVHNFVPDDFTKVIIIPLLKSKIGNLADKNNYRPIALTTIISKIFECIILQRCEVIISDNQFGFKKQHSTDLCLYAFKETVSYYVEHGSPVFACFLDASKAFDRVNHWTLFKKLLEIKIPVYIVHTLVNWYGKQLYYVRWGSVISSAFHVTNGVRQGGILSPMLFNIYIDELNRILSYCNVGLRLPPNGLFLNNFSFADDMSLISPSVAGLRKLLKICEQYALENDIIYNTQKSVCMVFQPTSFKLRSPPSVHLNGNALTYVDSYMYLGHILKSNLSDNEDMMRHYRYLCTRTNMLLRKFKPCSLSIKIKLFKSYCCTMYCAPLWTNFSENVKRKLVIGYNNSLRFLLGLPRWNSASNMFVNYNVFSFEEVMRKYVFSMITRLSNSENCILKSLWNYDIHLNFHIISRWNKLLFKYAT
jgi:hypothetical protein